MMSEYWLISAPGDKTCQQTFDTMNNLTNKQNNLCNNYKFHIPDLKVGTLDQLVGLSDDLGKLDTYVEQITRKVAGYLGEVLEDQRDKLHENLLANNSPGPGPGPPDERMHPHTHPELTGKASNLSNSRATTTTTISTCSACHTTTTTGSLNNEFSSATTEISERDYDYLATTSSSPVCCHCDDCADASAVRPSPNTPTSTNALSSRPSASGTLAADDCCHHQQHLAHTPHPHHQHPQQHDDHQVHSPLSCSSPPPLPTPPHSAHQVFSSVARAAAAAAAACAISTVNASPCNSKYAHDGNGSYLARSAPVASKMNNNTCCINNNKWSDSFSHSCHINPHYHHLQQQQHIHPQPHHVQLPNLHFHHREEGGGGAVVAAVSSGASEGGCGRGPCDAVVSSNLRSSNSTSDVSDTFDWWFYKRKRNSKKSRSSPVSSCCGSSSHGRSSPDTEIGEPPAFPLSPAELSVYLTRFQWDMAKYPIKQSLRNIADIISKQIGQIDADLKTKSGAYNNLKGSLQNLEKKQTGSLLTRNLADLVKKDHFILDSEYLTTLLVIVPKISANDWMANYEKITDMIVPRSSTMITQDNDYCLFNVTLFKKVVEEFKLHAREKKFIVRDFVYNEEELAAGKNEITKLITDKKKQFGPLVRWLKVNFSESFCALVHVKALRVFVESVLRYGLPVNFQAILIEPNKKSVKRLRDCLNQLYGHLDGASAAGQGSNVDNVEIPGLGFGQSEYFPYVFYKLNIDMVETAKI